MGKKEETTGAPEAAEVRALKRKGTLGMGATSGGPLGDRIMRGGDVVTEPELGTEKFEKLLAGGGFDLVKVAKTLLVVLAFAMIGLASIPASADGTSFTYPAKIGWGGGKLDQLPTVFDSIDTAFSGVKGAMHSPVATVTALKAVPATGATARADNQVILVDAGPTSGAAIYQFDASSAAAGNDNTVVVPTAGTGRWLKIADFGDTAKSSVLVSTSNGLGASLLGVEDAAPGYFTGTTVEAVLREIYLAKPNLVNPSVSGNFVSFSGTGGGQADSGSKAADFATASQGSKADTAMQPVVPLVPHSIYTAAGTTGAPEDSGFTTSMFTQIKRVRINGPVDGNAHDTSYTIPADAIVLDAWAIVATPDADPPGLTIDIGVNGNADGYLNNVPIDTAGGGLCTPVLDGTNNWFASTLCGDLLSTLVAGTNADDRGLWSKFPDVNSGGVALAYQASGAATAAVVDVYLVIAQPQ